MNAECKCLAGLGEQQFLIFDFEDEVADIYHIEDCCLEGMVFEKIWDLQINSFEDFFDREVYVVCQKQGVRQMCMFEFFRGEESSILVANYDTKISPHLKVKISKDF